MATNFTADCSDCGWKVEENDAVAVRGRAANHEFHTGHEVAVEEDS